MKFSDNLQKLRKKKGLSQEALAEQLDVTRQSVSKWESGASYPEMDKLLALCNIFDVELETLLNKDVLEKKEKREKAPSTGVDFLGKFDEIMKKIIYFFDHMSAKELMQFIFTIFVVIFLLACLKIPFDVFVESIDRQAFYAMGNSIGSGLSHVWNLLMGLIYMFFVLAVFLYVLKIKYIDRITIEKVSDQKEKIIIKEEAKELVVKDETKQEPGSISRLFSQMITYFLKFMAIIFLFCMGLMLLGIICCFGFSISLIIKGFPILGITICLLGGLLLGVLIFEIPLNFVLDHKNSFKQIAITGILSIILLVLGSATFALECFQMTFINDVPENIEKKKKDFLFPMTENLTTLGLHSYGEKEEYVVDNTLLDQVKVEACYYDYLGMEHEVEIQVIDEMLHLHIQEKNMVVNFNEMLSTFGEDLKKKKIYNYEKLGYTKIKIYASEENLEKIHQNNRKSYEIDDEIEEDFNQLEG